MKLFEQYHTLDLNSQGSYLMGLVETLPVQRRRHGTYEDSSVSRRQSTVSYTVPDGEGNLKRVCKKTFMNIFSISSQKLATIVKKKKAGEITYKDKRGGPTSFKYTNQDRQLVKNHINSFPRDDSHYGRGKSEKEYLSSDLNVTKLFEAFKIKYPDSEIKIKFYRKVFLTDFKKLSFHRPRVDTCKTCDLLSCKSKSLNTREVQEAKKKLEIHHRKAENAYNLMKKEASDSMLPNSTICNIVMDLQKVFPLPKLSHSDMYYSRQLSCYNFGLHVSDTDDGIMCVWHEGDSGRGGNQIASCLLQAINSDTLKTGKRNLSIWSDNCGGQLKNRMVVFLYIFLISCGLMDKIEHKFLMSGHSYSSADRDFGIIERRAKVSKMEVVEDVIQVIQSARTIKPFKTIEMADKFFNFDAASRTFINTKALGISKVTCLRITKDEPGYVSYKKSYSELEEWSKCYVFQGGVTVEDIKDMQLLKLDGNLPISEAKKKDLLSMIDFLKEEKKDFYRRLCGAID